MRRISVIFKISLFLMFLIFIIFAYIENQQKKMDYVNLEVYGVVDRIEYFIGDRGMQSLMINGEWVSMGIEGQKIKKYLKVGDSIVKVPGTRRIKIYRETREDFWYERNFR